MSITANYARISGAILRRKACPCLAVAQPGASVWGTGVWGGQDAVLRQIKLKVQADLFGINSPSRI